jgi:hypothetical protein
MLKNNSIKSIKRLLRNHIGYPGLWLNDVAQNRRYATADRRFLMLRHGAQSPHAYEIILNWVAEHFPDIRARFELHQLPCWVFDWSRYILHVPWLQDPVQQWSLAAYAQANQIAAKCDQSRIPIINRVDKLINATKSKGSQRIGSTGVRTPRIIPIERSDEFMETLLGLTLPLIIREDWGHSSLMLRVERKRDVHDIPFNRFSRPVAVEFIDTQSRRDGLYRKYRYIAAGSRGVTQSMHVQKSWIVRGTNTEFSDKIRDEEIAFINNPDPNHAILQQARIALELDFIAFDYSYDPAGRLIVWEANPDPFLHFPGGKRIYRKPAVERTLAALLHLYLKQAGLAIPSRIEEMLAGYSPE